MLRNTERYRQLSKQHHVASGIAQNLENWGTLILIQMSSNIDQINEINQSREEKINKLNEL